ncbi:Methionyl-tRNA formyltransferase, mitochondrial [Candida tropicalis]
MGLSFIQFSSIRAHILVFKRSLTTRNAKSYDPLKIAFFGSDTFSVASLLKLTQYQSTHPQKIDNIHVITRSIKPTGRNLKNLIDLPIGIEAQESNIPILRADTSSEILDILNSHHFNLAIAVSYGRLIPAEFISSCKYGGLNVHPSLLPKYSGSSPLQFALLNDDKFTGCTVQTLHPTKFDHGDILLQSNEVSIEDNDNISSLLNKFGQIGGDLLVDTLHQGLFVNPTPVKNNYQFSLAPKINKSKSQALWSELTAREIKRVYDALGPIYTFISVNLIKKRKPFMEKQRVILSKASELINHDDSVNTLVNPGDFTLGEKGLIVKAKEGYVLAESIKMQAQSEESPESFIGSYNRKVGNTPKQFIN